jgi:hypothetical protein
LPPAALAPNNFPDNITFFKVYKIQYTDNQVFNLDDWSKNITAFYCRL